VLARGGHGSTLLAAKLGNVGAKILERLPRRQRAPANGKALAKRGAQDSIRRAENARRAARLLTINNSCILTYIFIYETGPIS
jgi:hypothetical protein